LGPALFPQMRTMWLFLSVAIATKTAETALSSRSPVEKVVALLRDMQATLEAEAKEDAKLYEKLTCWCKQGDSSKSAAVADAQAAVSALTSEIEARGKAAEQLVQEIAAQKDDTKRLQASFLAAEQQREQEAAENHATIVDLRNNLDTIKTAIYVLHQHQATAFPQLKVDFLALGAAHRRTTGAGAGTDLDALSKWMDAHNFASGLSEQRAKQVDAAVLQYRVSNGEATPAPKPGQYSAHDLQVLSAAKKLVTNFVQSHAELQTETGHMGEIFGVMEQMKENFASELEELEASEKAAVDEYEGMAAAQKKAIAESERITTAKEVKAAENAKAKADAEENLEGTKAALDADTKFLVELKEVCATQDKQMAERTAARQVEMKAVGEALQILADNDNKDLFTKSLGDKAVSFVQLSDAARDRAVRVLQRSGSPELLQLAAVAKRDKFPKVIAAIDDLIAGLKVQQKEEVDHKKWCEESKHENEMTTHQKNTTLEGVEAKIADAKNQLEAVADEMAATQKALAEGLVALQEANSDRVEQAHEFQTVVNDQRATQEVLFKVLDKLAKVYGEGPAFLQTASTPERAPLLARAEERAAATPEYVAALSTFHALPAQEEATAGEAVAKTEKDVAVRLKHVEPKADPVVAVHTKSKFLPKARFADHAARMQKEKAAQAAAAQAQQTVTKDSPGPAVAIKVASEDAANATPATQPANATMNATQRAVDAQAEADAAADERIAELKATAAKKAKAAAAKATAALAAAQAQAAQAEKDAQAAAAVEQLAAAKAAAAKVRLLRHPAAAKSPEVRTLEAKREADYTHILNTKVDDPVAVQEEKRMAEAKLGHKAKAPSTRASLVQGKAKQTPPGQFSEYKKHAGGSAVIVMLKGLIKDAQQLEKDAIADENAAVTEYSAYVNEAQAARAALQGKIISAQERKAGLEVQVAQGVRATDELMADLAALADEEGQLHKSCDFVQQNFDVRQKARAQELEALAQAKAILSGAGAGAR